MFLLGAQWLGCVWCFRVWPHSKSRGCVVKPSLPLDFKVARTGCRSQPSQTTVLSSKRPSESNPTPSRLDFFLQDRPAGLAAVAAERQIGAHHPVAGHFGRAGVAPQCLAHSPWRAASHRTRQTGVSHHPAAWNAPQLRIDPFFERCGFPAFLHGGFGLNAGEWKPKASGGADGARTRDLQRDRLAF